MRLSKQTGYAIRILIHCAMAGDRQLRAGDIARLDGITEYNVAKIVPILVRGGFLKTTRGRAGGLQLAQPPGRIRIGDVIRVTETTHLEAECGGHAPDCGIKAAAPINRMLDEALGAFVTVLDQHTLAELVSSRALHAQKRKPRDVPAPAKEDA